jgi:hypothetical protein
MSGKYCGWIPPAERSFLKYLLVSEATCIISEKSDNIPPPAFFLTYSNIFAWQR